MSETLAATSENSGSKTGGSLSLPGGAFLTSVRSFTAQPSFQRSMPAIIAVLASFVGLVIYAVLQQPDRTTLYASLPEAEKARVVEALKNSGVDVVLDPTTGDVMVPSNDYYSSRITLAAQGLPTSVPDGYDSLTDLPMGTSRSVENVRLKQSQEVELAKSISEIDSIISARVHLAIPEKSVFVRNNPEPTASIFVQLAQGRRLGRQQVEAIVHLVASSVPSLAKQNVTIIDQNGDLLSKPVDDPSSMLTDAQLEYRMRLEDIYRTRIISLVTPIVGAGNVNAQVNLDIDFTRSERTEELVDPKGNALRSEQSTLDEAADLPARGIPGAVSNTPPTEAELEVGSNMSQTDAAGKLRTRSSSEVKNYEVSRVVSTTQDPSNRIARLNASVLVRDMDVIDPETGEKVSQPLAQETLDEIQQLVRDAVGVDETRGDRLTVSSSPFMDEMEGFKKSWHEQEWFSEFIKQFSTILILGIITLGVIRPLLTRIFVPVGAGVPGANMSMNDDEVDIDTIEVGEGESLEDIKAKLKPKKQSISAEMLDTANTYDDKVAVIRMMVSDEAGRVANVFKSMMKRDIETLN